MDAILAHAGGLDELAIILFPILVGLGVWLMTRQKNPPQRAPVARPDQSADRVWARPADRGE